MLRVSIAAVLSATFAIAHATPAPLTATQVLNQMNAVSLTNIDGKGGHVHGRTWAKGSVTGGEYGNQLDTAPASNYAGLTAGSVSGVTDAWGNTQRVTVNRGGLVTSGSINGVNVNEGTNVVGGDVANSTLNRASQVAGSAANATFNAGATIGGSLSGSSVNGGAYVGGSASNSNINGGATIVGAVANTNTNGGAFKGLTADFTTASAAATSTSFGTVLGNLSTTLSQLKSTGSTVDITGNKALFTAKVDASGVAVFDLTGLVGEQLFAADEFKFSLNGATTVIMNTDIKSASIHANFVNGGARAVGSQVIWNFYDATSVTISSQFGGAVLATDALVTNTADIEGGLFANALSLQAQVHVQPFTGNVEFLSPVPEPSAVAMIVAGLAVFGVGRARRRECFTRE